MEANIIEIVGKKRRDFTLVFIDTVNGSPKYEKINFSGEKVWIEWEEYIHDHKAKIESIVKLNLYHKFCQPEYLRQFKNLKHLSIGSGVNLIFPDLSGLSNLEKLFINQQSKESDFKNIWTIPNLKELFIGDFSFSKRVEISSLNEILQCVKLEKLVLNYVTLPKSHIRELKKMKSLVELRLPVNTEVEDLAYLSAKLHGVISPELQPYQFWKIGNTDVKVNGNRRPFLDSKKDKLKLDKYVIEFEKLKLMFENS